MKDEYIEICQSCGGDRVFTMDSWIGDCKKCNKATFKSGIIDDVIRQVDQIFEKKGDKNVRGK